MQEQFYDNVCIITEKYHYFQIRKVNDYFQFFIYTTIYDVEIAE